jgi:outer membrane lipoprotein carrier protein
MRKNTPSQTFSGRLAARLSAVLLPALLLPAVLLLVAQGAAAQDMPGDGAAEDPGRAPELLRAFLAETVTLEARFSQVLLEADSEHSQVSEGRFYLHRPQRFRWDYTTPVPQLVVADGEHLWLYDPDLEQATVRRLDDGLSSTPAMLLSGNGSLEETFRIGAAYVEDGFDWVELAPRSGDADFAAMRVGFVDGLLASMELIDALGQTTIIRFEEVEVNLPLEASLFEFVPPPGADVIRDEGF